MKRVHIISKVSIHLSTVDSHEKGEEGKTKGFIFIALM